GVSAGIAGRRREGDSPCRAGADMKRPLQALGLACLALAAGCRQRHDDSLITASGHVEATDVRLATKVAGHLEHFGVEEGDRVASAQELARMDTTDARLALSQAAAERDLADAELRLRLAGSRKEDV